MPLFYLPGPPDSGGRMKFRRSELLLSAYFIYAAIVAVFRPITPQLRVLIFSCNAAVMFWFCIFAWANKERGFTMLDRVRDWFPYPLILLAFREVGWMALPHSDRNFENYWVQWDRMLLYDWGWKRAIESLGPLLPDVLELAYLLVYVVPVVTILVFYQARARERIDDAYSILLFATLTTYALYPYFPSEPPRSVFIGADLPPMNALRALNLRLVGDYGIHTSVFPSGHSAAAFSAAFAIIRLLPEQPWFGRGFLILATLIALGSFYGRYHFAIDAIAGFAMACLAIALSFVWQSRRPRR